MRRILILSPILFLLFAGFFNSCKEDINFSGDFEETPVIIGLLDQTDTLQYVKVMRTFGGSNNAIDVAQIEDSNYFDQVEVRVEEWRKNSNQVYELARYWDLADTLLTNKASGAFFSPNQIVYYFNATQPTFVASNYTSASNQLLNDNAEYRMTATLNNGEVVVTGNTEMVTGVGITQPNNLGSLSFANSLNGQTTYQTANVKANTGNAKVMDCRLHIYINEYFNNNPVEKLIEWKIDEYTGNEVGSTSNFTLSGASFYNIIKAGITNDATITKRELNRIEIVVTGGTDALSQYILVNQPSSSLAQNKPSYTNLTRTDGKKNVIGIFSARKTVKMIKLKYLPSNPSIRAIDQNSEKELCTGLITGTYLFCSDNILYNTQSYYCQ